MHTLRWHARAHARACHCTWSMHMRMHACDMTRRTYVHTHALPRRSPLSRPRTSCASAASSSCRTSTATAGATGARSRPSSTSSTKRRAACGERFTSHALFLLMRTPNVGVRVSLPGCLQRHIQLTSRTKQTQQAKQHKHNARRLCRCSSAARSRVTPNSARSTRCLPLSRSRPRCSSTCCRTGAAAARAVARASVVD